MYTALFIYAVFRSVILALAAIGFNLTFGISGVANFAYGALYVLAAYLYWFLLKKLGFPYSLSLVVSVVCIALLGGLIYRFCLLRLRGQTLSEVIVTFGIGLVILEVVRDIVGGVGYELPLIIDKSLYVLDTYIDMQRLIVLIVCIFLFLSLWIFTHHSRMGLAFRGIAQNELTSLSLGINSDWMGTLSMAIGSGLAAIAAIAILPLGTVNIIEGYEVLINALAVCIIGGLGSIGGVVAASFIIGFAQQITDSFIGSEWIMVVSLGAIITILIFKPSGLFGRQKELEERV
jgi:branched-chain amino acid transport system permease protein